MCAIAFATKNTVGPHVVWILTFVPTIVQGLKTMRAAPAENTNDCADEQCKNWNIESEGPFPRRYRHPQERQREPDAQALQNGQEFLKCVSHIASLKFSHCFEDMTVRLADFQSNGRSFDLQLHVVVDAVHGPDKMAVHHCRSVNLDER